MLVTKNDRNLVDFSVNSIIQLIPPAIKGMANIFVKYGQLIDQKYIALSQSDERRRIKGINALDSLTHLTFDKMLFALDKDAYIDFMNEIKTLEVQFGYDYDGKPDRTYGSTENKFEAPGLNCILFKYLVNPADGLSRILESDCCRLDEGVPLIKVIPRFHLDTPLRSDSEVNKSKYDVWFENDVATCILKPSHCEAYIDISQIFDLFAARLSRISDYRNPNDSPFKNLSLMKNESMDEFISNISEVMSNRIIYSLSTTYMATVTKLIDEKINPVFETFGDILDSCRRLMLDDFDSMGENAKTGVGLRHMAIDVSTLLNALSYLKESGNYECQQYYALMNMIEYITSLKYETYNYEKIPLNNLKHKKLIPIGNLAKSNVSLLSGDTRAGLQCAYSNISFKNDNGNSATVMNLFQRKRFAEINGTFALNKRIYDAGKDFVDVFARFIIIKKRMYDAGGLNFADGTIDTIGKRYVDYKSYLKSTYNDVKTSLTNIFNRMKSVTIGKRYLNSGNFMVKNDDENIRNANTIIYGINTETNFSNDFTYKSIYSEDKNQPVGWIKESFTSKKVETSRDINPNAIINDIRLIYNVLKDRPCTYADNSSYLTTALNTYGNGSLISLWIAINECTGNFFDSPFENIKGFLGDVTMTYTVDSINEMAPINENSRKEIKELEFRDWATSSKGYKTVEQLRLSFEDLKQKIEDAEEQDGESVVGGCLFGDFGGIQLAGDVTAKEAEFVNDDLSVKTQDPEYESFESFKHEFDSFLSKYL